MRPSLGSDWVPSIDDGRPLPDARHARADGLVAYGGAMTVDRLLEAYRGGIFPWTADPVTWWSPDPRAIFDLDHIHTPRSLRPALRRHGYRATFDTDFDAVIEACALAPRWGDQSWISEEFQEAYKALHRAGFGHSIELWSGSELAAGLYGVAIGGFFAGESMFHRERNASKIALVLLEEHLHAHGFRLFDTQMLTPVTELMGAQLISRDEYLTRLQSALALEVSFTDPQREVAADVPAIGSVLYSKE